MLSEKLYRKNRVLAVKPNEFVEDGVINRIFCFRQSDDFRCISSRVLHHYCCCKRRQTDKGTAWHHNRPRRKKYLHENWRGTETLLNVGAMGMLSINAVFDNRRFTTFARVHLLKFYCIATNLTNAKYRPWTATICNDGHKPCTRAPDLLMKFCHKLSRGRNASLYFSRL